MASGDSTEFTAKITVDSKQAEKNVENLGDQTEDTAEKFVSLKSQIRQTTVELQKLETEGKAATAEFQKMRAKLDDLNDAQDRASFKAGQFDDKLSAMPGVLGQAGGALKTFNDSVNQFGKTLTYSLGIVGLIVSGFLLLKESLESTAEGQALLTRVSTAFQKVLGPLLAIVEKVAVPVFEALASGLEAVARGFASAAEFIGISSSKIAEASSGVKDFKKQADDLAKAEQEKADKAKAAAEAAAAKAKAAREKAAAEAKANADAALKVQIESAINLLDDQNKEITIRTLKLNDDLLALQKAGITNTTSTWESYNKDKAAIDKKYADEAQKKQEELDGKTFDDMKALSDKTKEQQEKSAEDKRALTYQTIEGEIAELDRLNDKYDNDFAEDRARLEEKKLKVAEEKDLALTNLKLTEAEKLKIIQDAADKERDIDKSITATKRAELEARKQLQLQYVDAVAQFGSILSSLAGENKDIAIAGLVIEQAAAIARITINTLSSASTIAATSPLGYLDPRAILTFVAGGFSVIQAGIAAKKGIDAIKAAPGPGGGGGGASAGAAPSIQAPRVGNAAAPQMAEGVGANPSTQIAQTIGNASKEPVRAYVVSQDITSQQQLDRKSNQAAVF
jgi:hypothetical protein